MICVGIWNPDKKPEKIILRTNSQLKSLTLLPLWVASSLCGFFFQIRRELIYYHVNLLSVRRLSTVIVKYQGWILNSQKPTKWSQIFLVKMSPRLKFHRRIQG